MQWQIYVKKMPGIIPVEFKEDSWPYDLSDDVCMCAKID